MNDEYEFTAEIKKINTRVDNSIDVTLNVPEYEIAAWMALVRMWAQHPIVRVRMVEIDD